MKEKKVIIQPYTTHNPIVVMGYEAGACWGADVSGDYKNYIRGLDCVKANHGRLLEYPQIFMTIEGYSARVIREFYTHIGGSPTRLQASTRRVDYKFFNYITPPSIRNNDVACKLYDDLMQKISRTLVDLENLGVPREDAALCLPLGMESTIVVRTNLRNLVDMSHQRMCAKTYHEFHELFSNIIKELTRYDSGYDELNKLGIFAPKCKIYGKCNEKVSCGFIRKDEKNGRN